MVRLSAIGDCVHALPVVEALRRAYPGVRIGWAIQSSGQAVVRAFAGVDEYHLFPRRGGLASKTRELLRFTRQLRSRHYDVALDLQGNSKSGLVARLSGAGEIYGLPPGDRRELNSLLVPGSQAGHEPKERARHVIERNLAVLEPLGVTVETPCLPALSSPELQALGRSDVARARDVVLCPGTTWDTKLWPRSSYAALASSLVSEGRRVEIFWGGALERAWAGEILETVHSDLGAGAERIDLAPALELDALATYFRPARLVVGNDSGPLHLAAALGCPAVALFGPTDPQRNGLFWPGTRSLSLSGAADVECRPCWSRQCARGDLACLNRLDVAAVRAACREVELERRG
jgi:heptosyltransferase-1